MKRHLNLLPLKMRMRLLVRTQLRRWVVVWGIAAITGMFAWVEFDGEFDALEQHVDTLKKKCEPIADIRKQHAGLMSEKQRVTKRLELIAKLQDPQAAYRLIGLVSKSARSCDGGIRVRDFWLSEERVQVASAAATAVKKAKEPKRGRKKVIPKKLEEQQKPAETLESRLVLQGVAADNLAVAKFVVSLRESGAFNTVDLKSSMGVSARARVRTYRIECVF